MLFGGNNTEVQTCIATIMIHSLYYVTCQIWTAVNLKLMVSAVSTAPKFESLLRVPACVLDSYRVQYSLHDR